MLAIESTFPQFTDIRTGQPLTGGAIYFGQVGQNPETNPITVYWDIAGTQPAAQPIKTLNGYPARLGTPANVFAQSDYSITVRNAAGAIMHTASSAATNAAQLASANGSAGVGFEQAGSGAVPRTAQDKMRESVSIEDFGGVADWDGTTGTDNTAAMTTALASLPAAGGELHFGPGAYLIATPPTLSGFKHLKIVGVGGSEAKNDTGATELIFTTGALVIDSPKVTLESLNLRGATGHAGDGVDVGHTPSGNVNGFQAIDVGFYGFGQDGLRIGLDAGINANNFCLINPRFIGNTRHGLYISDSAVSPNANGGMIFQAFSQSNGDDGVRYGSCLVNTQVGGVFEGNSGCGLRMVTGAGSNSVFGGDFEANKGTANISIEAGAVNNKIDSASSFYESINDAGTNTRIDAPSNSGEGWVSKGPFRMFMADNGAGNDIISGASGGDLRLFYGGDALTDSNSQMTVGVTGLKLGKSTSGAMCFFDIATPIAKQTTAAAAASFADSGSTVVHTASTFDGYTVGQLVRIMRLYGLLQ